MKNNSKKAPASAATLTGAQMGAGAGQATTSIAKFITAGHKGQRFSVAALLSFGVENAIPRRDLMTLTGLPDRVLRRLIEAERRAGTPILSDNASGYYLPASEAKREQCVRSLRSRAKEIVTTANAIEKAVVE